MSRGLESRIEVGRGHAVSIFASIGAYIERPAECCETRHVPNARATAPRLCQNNPGFMLSSISSMRPLCEATFDVSWSVHGERGGRKSEEPNRLMTRLADDCLGTYSPAVMTVQPTRIESRHTEAWRPCRCKASTFIKVSKSVHVESLN